MVLEIWGPEKVIEDIITHSHRVHFPVDIDATLLQLRPSAGLVFFFAPASPIYHDLGGTANGRHHIPFCTAVISICFRYDTIKKMGKEVSLKPKTKN